MTGGGGGLPDELAVVRDVSHRLDAAGLPYMLTGSLAMNYYVEPRMTRDIDVIIDEAGRDAARIAAIFQPEYYVSREAVAEAIALRTSFNAIHLLAAIKVDCFPRKPGEFRAAELHRRRRVAIAGFETSIATIEDLVLAKLLWARESRSELQRRDVRKLLEAPHDAGYISDWVARLDLADLWQEVHR
ncbi:MAG TPA: hypothetical protein VFW66_14415 [Gemmatimonadales bacterium]|nr:hypothetical protein [Gemmatimonadales bacterium]